MNHISVRSLVNFYIYQPTNPDWSGLQKSLIEAGFESGEVFEIMFAVRCGEM